MIDLLIIYSDGTKKIVEEVADYSLDMESNCFTFTKNGYKSFVSRTDVRFFGREFDYMNKEVTKN